MASRPTAPVPRPLSPHLTIWKWRVHMAVSILHRATGQALAFGAVLIFAWWLAALASGPSYYRLFLDLIMSPVGVLVGFGLTWSLFQHMGSGLRHFIMDSGEGYDLVTSRRTALATFAFSTIATLAFWAWILLGKGY
ncbi:succinate dehydrogenase, cytochrome b556 subunit [Sandarakinorhabdus oryzae]|uniref:succinate dehydrogenase, cytochrome b556 subunit n=1 Tax=Sandarakinorhabdus oryzae TaxID=2675220 RepID=UPI0012E1707B|nr:succinate dehydrogenase, cytochrome b556 subunit [Sandarakinorhabdus oryzae]